VGDRREVTVGGKVGSGGMPDTSTRIPALGGSTGPPRHVLRITLDAPGLNAVRHREHGESSPRGGAQRSRSRKNERRVGCCRGAGKRSRQGGSSTYRRRCRQLRAARACDGEARISCQSTSTASKPSVGEKGTATDRCGIVAGSACRRLGSRPAPAAHSFERARRSASPPARDHAAI